MGAGSNVNDVMIRGQVFNASNCTLLCWVQDDDRPEIFMLGPNRASAPDRDVDLVRGWTVGPPGPVTQSAFLEGTSEWLKFGDGGLAIVRGTGPNLSVNVVANAGLVDLFSSSNAGDLVRAAGLTAGVMGATFMGQVKAFQEGGLRATSKVKDFLQPDPNWGIPIGLPFA